MKLRINEGKYLIEDIAAVKKYYPNIDDNTFMTLIALDPTYRDGSNSVGKYGKWILNLYNKGTISEDDFGEITPLLNQFNTYKNRIQNKDLNAYKTLDDLDAVVSAVVDDDSMLSDRQKLRFKKNVKAGRVETSAENDYETVYEDSDWVVWVPHTHEASMKLGKGTEWCTAHENPDWYNMYTYDDGEEFSLYIMKNKSTGERFQYCDNPYRGYNFQFMDENDSECDPALFMHEECEGDQEFKDFLVSLNEEFFKDIQYVGDEGDLEAQGTEIVGVKDGTLVFGDVDIPNGITSIGLEAFYENNDINSVRIPSSLEIIGERAFANSTLQKIKLSDADSLEYIGVSAFYGCNLSRVYLPDSVVVIGNRAFCRSELEEITIGQNIKHIGALAFGNSGLIEIYIPDSVSGLEIGNLAFDQCLFLKKVILPDKVVSISDNAFNKCDFHNLTIYSNSEYVENYCEEHGIKWEEY